jgi:hypothetical protein
MVGWQLCSQAGGRQNNFSNRILKKLRRLYVFFFKLGTAPQNSAQHGSLVEFLANNDKTDNKEPANVPEETCGPNARG